jgi:hypothetical protein
VKNPAKKRGMGGLFEAKLKLGVKIASPFVYRFFRRNRT